MRRSALLPIAVTVAALFGSPADAHRSSLQDAVRGAEQLAGVSYKSHGHHPTPVDVPSPGQSHLPTDCASSFLQGQAPRLVNVKLATQTRELCNPGYAVLHNGVTRTPLWSAEHLTRARIRAAIKLPRQDTFRADERLPAAERGELANFARSGYDRGHMSPNKDFPDTSSEASSFLLSNMIPQSPQHNQGLWAHIEEGTRQLALEGHDVWVVTGPSFLGNSLQRVGGRVAIPTHVWKAVYVADAGRAAAWWTTNSNSSGKELISLDELERRTGIDAFPAVSAHARQVASHLPTSRARRS